MCRPPVHPVCVIGDQPQDAILHRHGSLFVKIDFDLVRRVSDAPRHVHVFAPFRYEIACLFRLKV